MQETRFAARLEPPTSDIVMAARTQRIATTTSSSAKVIPRRGGQSKLNRLINPDFSIRIIEPSRDYSKVGGHGSPGNRHL
jgi:hypothetical protein